MPPFTQTPGTATSFFDVFFEVEVGGRILHNETPKRLSSRITHKPPAPGDVYEGTVIIPLLDESNASTGIRLGNAFHIPRPGTVERDPFPATMAQVTLVDPSGQSHTVQLSGPSEAHVFFEGPAEGNAGDNDGNGRDEVRTELTRLDLTGTSSVGPVVVRLNPGRPSVGLIEETANTQPGRLDLPPFAPGGTADSFFDVFFEIRVGTLRSLRSTTINQNGWAA
jgi:hypothetical protein